MDVGVLGGGFQGCCVALALAERGAKVTLFDKNERTAKQGRCRQRRQDPPRIYVCRGSYALDSQDDDGRGTFFCAHSSNVI